jgi:hypothetical protein
LHGFHIKIPLLLGVENVARALNRLGFGLGKKSEGVFRHPHTQLAALGVARGFLTTGCASLSLFGNSQLSLTTFYITPAHEVKSRVAFAGRSE